VAGHNGIALKNSIRAALGLKRASKGQAAEARKNLRELNTAIARTASETVQLGKSLRRNGYNPPGDLGDYNT
jgi:hypothetical protein